MNPKLQGLAQQAARKAEEERLRKEAEAKAAAAQPGAPAPTPEPTVAPTPTPPRTQTLFAAPALQAPAKLAGSMTRRPWKYEVMNLAELYKARPDLCSLAESPSAINAAIRGGLRECAGIRIFQDVEVGVRV